MTPTDWTAATTPYIEQFGPIPILQNDEGWQRWGAAISVLATLAGIVVPNPYDFTVFEDWAARFNESLQGIS